MTGFGAKLWFAARHPSLDRTEIQNEPILD